MSVTVSCPPLEVKAGISSLLEVTTDILALFDETGDQILDEASGAVYGEQSLTTYRTLPPLSVATSLNASTWIAWIVAAAPLVVTSSLAAKFTITITPPALEVTTSLAASLLRLISCPPLLVTTGLAGTPFRFTITDPVILYFCTLKGTGLLPDVTLPISSFQGRLRTGETSWLSVVVPGMEYAADIAARSTSDLIIRMAKAKAGVIYHTEQIARVTLDEIRTDEGGMNQSISLSGHRAQGYTAKTVTLTGAVYRSENNGLVTLRLATPDMYLHPGDTVVCGSDSFIADVITYTVSVAEQSMEVSERPWERPDPNNPPICYPDGS